MSARGRVEFTKTFGIGAGFTKQSLHLTIKTHAEFG
jgi:hypothetical protein